VKSGAFLFDVVVSFKSRLNTKIYLLERLTGFGVFMREICNEIQIVSFTNYCTLLFGPSNFDVWCGIGKCFRIKVEVSSRQKVVTGKSGVRTQSLQAGIPFLHEIENIREVS